MEHMQHFQIYTLKLKMGYLFINSLIKASYLLDKRDKFSFFIVRMQHFESNIPSTIFYGSIFSEFVRIARCTLKLEHFLLRASELYSRMLSQGANQSCINKQILKDFQRYPDILKKYGKNYKELVQELKNYLSSE